MYSKSPRNRTQGFYEVIPGPIPLSSQATSPGPMFASSTTSTPRSYHHHNTASTSYQFSSASAEASSLQTSSSPVHRSAAPDQGTDSHFDSLHDLLTRAGYKETRVVTPDRAALANMFSSKRIATPPRSKTRLVDDFSSDSPSLAADELRRAMQKSSASRATPKAKASASKSLPSRNSKMPLVQGDVPPMPVTAAAAAAGSGWFGSGWIFGPGSVFDSSSPPKVQPNHKEAEASSSTASVQSTTAPAPAIAPAAKRTATPNPVWSASIAYRSQKSRTAPVRKAAPLASTSNAAEPEEAWKALQAGGTSRRRPGLVDAFASPTKKVASSVTQASRGSPSKQRKWRQDRAAWRESLGDLQAMMDQSRARREANAAKAAAESATVAETKETTAEETEEGKKRDADREAVAKLLSGPALPFLSIDPAVAPRNGSATIPTHLSMRRMKSVEVLSKIIRERPSSSSLSSSSVTLDTSAGSISPTTKKRSTPPRLTVSSPRGISSPKELALEGTEFEPISVATTGQIIITNRRVAKKPRSKLRHVSSGSDLRSAAAKAAEEEALQMPKRGRTTTRSKPPISPELRGVIGTLSKGAKVQALRHGDFDVFDDNEVKEDESPTRLRRSRTPQRPLVLVQTNAKGGSVEDIFQPTRTGVVKKKDFNAKITKTSKIMRLIEEAENIPIINIPPSSQHSNGNVPLAERTSAAPQQSSDQHTQDGLSSSLSKKSRDRMHTITRVLGQRQPC